VYPGRLTTGKKFEKVAALAGAIKKKTELSVKVVFCDFPCMDIEPQRYKYAIRKIGEFYGLDVDEEDAAKSTTDSIDVSDNTQSNSVIDIADIKDSSDSVDSIDIPPNTASPDILFTSDIGYPNGFPRSGVFELLTLSSLFICPSYSESFGLTVLEAASRGNFLVLNEMVPALEELGKKLKAYFMRWDARNFGYDTKETYMPSEQAYLEEHATIIVNRMRDNPVLIAKTLTRQKFGPQWVWHHQLQPLIEP
jgi:glycosyltransferase involved in cell wall biosynthesis